LILAILGGALIGLSASLFWTFNGRIAGASGLLGGLLGGASDRAVRAAFLLGLALAGVLFGKFTDRIGVSALPLAPLAFAGLLVGVGTRLGGGCTSGHGVCGVSRFSRRSMIATCTFVAAGMITVFVVRHAFAGWGAP
jgi:hypothetical protein